MNHLTEEKNNSIDTQENFLENIIIMKKKKVPLVFIFETKSY